MYSKPIKGEKRVIFELGDWIWVYSFTLTIIIFLSDYWIRIKFYLKFLNVLFYIELKFNGNRTLRSLCNKIEKLLCKNYISFLIDL